MTVHMHPVAHGSLFDDIAADLGLEPAELAATMDAWRAAPLGAFDEIMVPDTGFDYQRLAADPGDLLTGQVLRRLGFEHYLSQPFPLFVYGTLRPGQPQWERLAGASTRFVPARCHGLNLYVTSGLPYPHAVETDDPHAVVVGECVWPGSSSRRLLAELDAYEEFDRARPSSSEYARVLRTVTLPRSGEETLAWTYVARGETSARLSLSGTLVPDGDWSRVAGVEPSAVAWSEPR